VGGVLTPLDRGHGDKSIKTGLSVGLDRGQTRDKPGTSGDNSEKEFKVQGSKFKVEEVRVQNARLRGVERET
jgi:hypothetical protein